MNTRMDNCSVVIICDKDYPARVAFSIITKVADEFKSRYSDKWNMLPPLPKEQVWSVCMYVMIACISY